MDSDGGPSGAVKIVCRSAKVMWKNRIPVIVTLVLFLFPSYAIQYASLLNFRTLQHNIREIVNSRPPMGLETIMGISGSLRKFILPTLLISLASLLLSPLFYLTVIYTVDAGLKKKELTLRNLMLEIRTKLKGVVVTQFYVYFISLGYLIFSSSLVLAFILGGDLSAGFYFLACLMAILSFLLLVYLQFVWYQGIVVSIVETGYHGLTALGMSADKIRGRRALAFRVNFLLILFSGFLSLLYSSSVNRILMEDTSFLLVGFFISIISTFMGVFNLAVHAVFYHECSSDPANNLDAQDKVLYNMVPSAVLLRDDVV